MAKKRPMTNAERVRKHRASKAARQQINLALQKPIVAKLDRQAKKADQTRSDYITTLIESGQTQAATTPQPTGAGELNEKEQLAVLHVLAQIDNDYLQQMAVDGMSAQRMRRAINKARKALAAQNPDQPAPADSKIRPANVTSNKKTKATKKRSTRTTAPTMLDAIGLSRLDTFKDSPTAVSVSAEIRDLSKISKGKQWHDWRSLPRKFMAVWEAKKHIAQFRKTHRAAKVAQRHLDEDKTLMEIIATYTDGRPDHRVVYQARRR